jgi:Family of unknown function (DUF6519)
MKADLTRSTFRREKHYSGVVMQQGRVQLDADWNEQVDIGAHLDETTRVDVIGACGIPVHAAGFAPSTLDGSSDLALSAGRAYVDGIVCENDASPIAVVQVGDQELGVESVVADGRELKQGDWIQVSATGVLPIARRLAGVSAADSMLKLEVPFTSAEQGDLKGAVDAVVQRLSTYLTQPEFPGDPGSDAELKPEGGLYLFYLDVWKRHRTALEDAEIREVALGGADHGTRTQTVWQVKRALLDQTHEAPTCATVPSWDELAPRTTGRMAARAQPQTTPDDLCTVPPGAGFRRGENQLYRVEVRKSGNLGEAEFTFSRENGSVTVPWTASDTDTLTVTTLGRDDVLGIGPGDWIEATDDLRELEGAVGALVKVKTALDNEIIVDVGTATDTLDISAYPFNPKVRRWDDPDGTRLVERPADNDGYLPLEDGVEVRFEDGFYRALDYWRVPARAHLGDVEWERDTAGNSLSLPPDGVAHHYCRLALIRFDDGVWEPVEDCRKVFPSLTEVGGGAATDPGVHVEQLTVAGGFVLRNDSIIGTSHLMSGIEIHCDREIEPGTIEGKPTCLVSVDIPYPVSEDDRALWNGVHAFGSTAVTLDSAVTVEGSTIVWKPGPRAQQWLDSLSFDVLKRFNVDELLVNLRLRGRFVYEAGNAGVNVDGEAFGLLEDGPLHEVLPSGDGRRGGDLELWFHLRPGGSGGIGQGGIVLAVPAGSSLLTSKAKRRAIPAAISAILPRDALAAAIPGDVELDAKAEVTPDRARKLLSRQRLGEPGTVPTVTMAAEEPLAGAGELVKTALEQHEVPLQVQVEPVASDQLARRIAEGGPRAPDLILVTRETLDAIESSSPGSIAAEGTTIL